MKMVMLLQMAEHGAVTSQTVIYGYLDTGESRWPWEEEDLRCSTRIINGQTLMLLRSLIWKPPPHYGTSLWLWTKGSQRSWPRTNVTALLPVSQTSADMRPRIDQRVPGYVSGYVRRFWQVRYPLNYGSLCHEA